MFDPANVLGKKMATDMIGANDVWNGRRDAQLNPILSSLNAQYDAQIDPTKRNTYAGWADRGWGQSGGATNAITNALAGLQGQRQGAINDATNTVNSNINQQRQTDAQNYYQQQQLKVQKKAAQPTFMGIPI